MPPKFLRRLVRVEQAITTLTRPCVFGGHRLELAATSDSIIYLFTSDYIYATSETQPCGGSQQAGPPCRRIYVSRCASSPEASPAQPCVGLWGKHVRRKREVARLTAAGNGKSVNPIADLKRRKAELFRDKRRFERGTCSRQTPMLSAGFTSIIRSPAGVERQKKKFIIC